MPTQESITELLRRARSGDEDARQSLWKILLPLLRQRARQMLNGNNVAGFVNTSDILQGAVEQLLRREPLGFQDQQHLMAFAVTAMRHLIIDLARKHKPNERQLVPVGEQLGLRLNTDVSWPEVDEILNQLAALNPISAKAVELRAFGGFNNDEIAAGLGCSVATVKRHMQTARAFIMGRLSISPNKQDGS